MPDGIPIALIAAGANGGLDECSSRAVRSCRADHQGATASRTTRSAIGVPIRLARVVRDAFLLRAHNVVRALAERPMKNLFSSLTSGNWRALLACFFYFDTGFTVWVMFGPLAPFIHKDIAMSPAELGFLVAVPVLGAAILRVTLGNLYQAYDGRRIALLGVALSALPSVVLLLSPTPPSYVMLLVLGVFLGVGGASFAVALPMAGSNYPPRVQGLVLGLAAAGNIGAVLDGFLFPGLAEHWGWQRAT